MLLISEEKELNSLIKCNKFFGGLNAKRCSLESLIHYNLSVSKE